jgi:hypothetical protein
MANELEPTGGANAGEPEGVAAGAAGVSDEEFLASLEPATKKEADPAEAEFLKRLEGLDPSTLPQHLKDKLELPFLQNYTRKYQQLSEQQQHVLDRVTGSMSQRGIEPTPDQRSRLLEEVKAGNFDVLDKFVDEVVAAKVGPQLQQQALAGAISEAERLHPFVKERQAEISQILASDPMLYQLATANNFAAAPRVLQAIAIGLENVGLKQQIEKLSSPDFVKSKQREAVEAYRRQVQGLPATTTRAGSSPTGGTPKEFPTMRDAAKAALAEMGQPIPEHW